jgi:hypothetical protein
LSEISFAARGCALREERKKNQKRKKAKEGEVCGNCHSPGNLARMLRNILLMISTAAWKTLQGFPQLPQTRRRLTNKREF